MKGSWEKDQPGTGCHCQNNPGLQHTLNASTGGAPGEGSSQEQSRGWTNWSSRPHTAGGIVWVPLLETIKLYKLHEISTITFTMECITVFLP